MANAFYGDDERSHHADIPELRMLTLNRAQASSDAQDAHSLAPYVWAPSSPATISPRVSGSFGTPYPSAACFYAARELWRTPPTPATTSITNDSVGGTSHDHHQEGQEKIPMGIITVAVGGTPIELWMPPAAILDGTPASLGGNGTCGGATTTTGARATNTGSSSSSSSSSFSISPPGNATCNPSTKGVSSLYHGMIAPLLPMRISAVLWYQGEENDHATDACAGPEW